uniref:Uncharacterized protein n=1 Tax=Timema cristinae TaxID=61476 RepID=A0A7R9H1D0_TIMCR|nr:unnamed protein product [Timema cristinae]
MPPFNSLLENVGAQILRVVALPQPSLRSDGTESPILGDHCDGTSSPADKPKTLTKYGELVILGFILMLSSHLGLDLPNGLLPLGLSLSTLNTFLYSPIHVACPVYRNPLA